MCIKYEDVYGWLKDKTIDKKMINTDMSVSDYYFKLLNAEELDHWGLRMPRIPIRIQNAITEKLQSVKSALQMEGKKYAEEQIKINEEK